MQRAVKLNQLLRMDTGNGRSSTVLTKLKMAG
jgi:hypothetical protein